MLLPETESLSRRVLTLPTGTDVGPEQISLLCQIIKTAVSYGSEVRDRLAEREMVSAAGAKFYSDLS